jgi:hypothetical protein
VEINPFPAWWRDYLAVLQTGADTAQPSGLIRTFTYTFSTLDRLLLLYSTCVRPKLQYVSVVWNSVTSTDARELERIQRKYAALCQNRFSNALGTYEDFLKNLKLHTVYDRRLF